VKEQFYIKLLELEDGSYDVFYKEKRYLLSKQTQLQGKLIKLYANELGDNDFVSLNYYVNIGNGLLKPCEMTKKKVIDFLLGMKLS
jgi:hypothetical protein